MRSIKNLGGYLVVVFCNDNSGAIAAWYEYNQLLLEEVIQLLRYIRNSRNLYWRGRYKQYNYHLAQVAKYTSFI